jgi:hypothetical protein
MSSPSDRSVLPKRTQKLTEPLEAGGGPSETPMPTGSGVLGSRARPDSGASSGMDLEAAERRRFQRAIKEKS